MKRPDLSAQYALLNADADRRLSDVSRRLDGAVSRAGVIIGSAAISAALQITHQSSVWNVIPMVFAVLAIVPALTVLFPRKGHEQPVRAFLQRIDEYDAQVLTKQMVTIKLAVIDEDECYLTIVSMRLTWSVLLLIATIVATGVVELFTVKW